MKPLLAGPAPRTQRRVSIRLDRCIRDGCCEPTRWGLCDTCANQLRDDVKRGRR